MVSISFGIGVHIEWTVLVSMVRIGGAKKAYRWSIEQSLAVVISLIWKWKATLLAQGNSLSKHSCHPLSMWCVWRNRTCELLLCFSTHGSMVRDRRSPFGDVTVWRDRRLSEAAESFVVDSPDGRADCSWKEAGNKYYIMYGSLVGSIFGGRRFPEASLLSTSLSINHVIKHQNQSSSQTETCHMSGFQRVLEHSLSVEDHISIHWSTPSSHWKPWHAFCCPTTALIMSPRASTRSSNLFARLQATAVRPSPRPRRVLGVGWLGEGEKAGCGPRIGSINYSS